MKICFKCKEEKCLSEFYKHKQMGDGHLNKCKVCAKIDSINNRLKNLDKYREYDRKRGSRLTQEQINNYRKKYPLATKARSKVYRMCKSGLIKKPNKCEKCGGKDSIVGHHDDYAFLTKVRWLCPPCHFKWHRENGEGKNKRLSIEEWELKYIDKQ